VILNKLDIHLDKKDDCKEIKNFEGIVKRRLDNKFECNYFIEGHFHQNRSLKIDGFEYINLAAFACNQRYFIVRFANKELLQCNKYLGE
jgi:UDP-2,3-diacylglucosamine hydrolase